MERKKGGEFVGAFPSYGYIKNPEDNHKLIIDKDSAEIVKKIFEWKVNEGLGNLSICHRLNDMGILNYVLEQYNCQVVSKRGKGYILKSENKELLKTIKAQEEQIRLLKQLIENQDKIIKVLEQS